jgi:tetratricopeptide (TPR) repeat protein
MARLRRVLALLDQTPGSPAADVLALQTYDDLLRVGSLGGLSRQEGESLFAAARALAERTGDRPLLARLLSTFGEFLFFAGQSADAQVYLDEANALAGELDDAAVRLSVAMDNMQTANWAGRLHKALEHSNDALRLLEHGMPAGSGIPVGLSGEAFVLVQRGVILSLMGRRREAVPDLERALRLAQESGSLEGRCVAHQFSALAALTAGDLTTAAAHAQAAMELAARSGNPFLATLSQATLGSVYAQSGRAREAIPMLAALTGEAGEALRVGAVEWLLLSVLAEAQRAVGDLPTACATAARAVELASANGALTSECTAHIALAAALVQTHGEAARVASTAALARADTLIAESGAQALRPRVHVARAECARVLGDTEGVCRELRTAQRLCRELGMDELADRVARELAAVDGAGGGSAS